MNEQGKMAPPDHVLAQYPDAVFFLYREGFVQHLVADLRSHVQGTALRCLDAGCNTGRYTAIVAQAGFDAVGLDYDEGMVAEARRQHPGLTFVQGDAQAMPFPEASFDCVVSLGLLQCIPDWRQLLQEIIRVLKPGGVALIETNRAAPVWEAGIKGLAYWMRGKLGPRAAWRLFRSHAASGRCLDNAGLRKFAPCDIRQVLRGTPLSRVIHHDPIKRGIFHDFVWAFTITKSGAGERGGGDVTTCPVCRGGIAGL